MGNYDKFISYNYHARAEEWRQGERKEIPNMYSITALGWKWDGSHLNVGTLCGALDAYDACVKRMTYKGAFEFTYVSLSQVIVKRMAGPSAGQRVVLKSHFNCEITNKYISGSLLDRFDTRNYLDRRPGQLQVE